ncbi:MAG: methyltransferase domain-containing protein [Pirellulaceae bacterium]
MHTETYTPGVTENASDFMARRTIESHGQFFLPHLTPGVSVLDCGCGPGTISLSIARRIAPGRLVGIDREPSQIEKAQAEAQQTGQSNADFQSAEIYALPFEDNSFDRVFSHALIEHLSNQPLAAKEMFRVLKPGGIIGVCSPDWGGFVLAPPSIELTLAITAYTNLQTNNGGDVNAGRKLGSHLQVVGFEAIQLSARYECYDSLAVIGEYLALQLERTGDSDSATTLREWSRRNDGMFAQCWVSCVARKPLADSSRRVDNRL